jgi:putative membrane protein insertion efficiency factor
MFLSCTLSGQSVSSDLKLIQNAIESHDHEKGHQHVSVPFAFPHTYNPVKLVLGSTMWVYQNLISPQLSASCLYEPSCSRYSVNLLRDYGVVKGIVYSADRLTRCNRLAGQDFSYTRINPLTGHIRETTDYYRLKQK